MKRRKHRRKRHVEGTTLAGVVLVTAALALASLAFIPLVGGVSGGQSISPRVAATAASPPPSPVITLPPDEPSGGAPLSSPETSPSGDEPVIAVPAPGGTPVTDSVDQAGADIHAWYADNAIKVEREWQAKLARRRLVWQIDTWLAQRGSPMAGCAEIYVQNQERTGIPATLSIGIAEAESSSGMACYGPHNAWGMIGYPGGWGSWQEGITANFDYLVRYFGKPQTMHDAPGYCEGDTTMQTVDDVQAAIARLDAGWIR